MPLLRFFSCALVALVLPLAGCATAPEADKPARQMPRFEPPPQPTGSVRLIIYRPQALVGMWGKPVVIVNGQRMRSTLEDSLLQPGSVFVVDAPANDARIEWIQSRQTQPTADALVVRGQPGATQFFRWTLEPTHGFLQTVDEATARDEIGALRFTGYRNLVESR